MKKQRKKYESPLMERTLVELEDGFCAGSATITNSKNAAIESHYVNDDFDVDFTKDETLGGDKWD